EVSDQNAVSISDDCGSTAGTPSTSTVTDAALTATGVAVSDIEGHSTGTVPVATFTDGNPLATTADFTATITWGDSTTSSGSVSETGSTFTVSGRHTYT